MTRKLTVLSCVLLASCGGGGGGDSNDWNQSDKADGRLIGGVKNLSFTTTGSIDGNTGKAPTVTGTTDVAGEFKFALNQPQTCTASTCSNSGPKTFSNVTFGLCQGQTLPLLRGPTDEVIGFVPAFTWPDFSTDPTVVDNLAAVALMLNVRPGDPAVNGVEFPSNLSKSTCNSFDWATPNIQQDAAQLQTVAKADGQAHEWPSQQARTDYVASTYYCSRAGFYGGVWHNNTDLNDSTLSGTYHAFIDTHGKVETNFDFGRQPNSAPYAGSLIESAGVLPVVPGGTASVTYTSPATDPIPHTATLTVTATGATGTFRSADGAYTGTTYLPATAIRNASGGMSNESFIDFPKYRILAKKLRYTRQGFGEQHTFNMVIDVGHDNKVEGSLGDWPALLWSDPEDQITGDALQFKGSMDQNNTLTFAYEILPTFDRYQPGAGSQNSALTIDLTTMTATGPLYGRDGTVIKQFTPDDPAEVCRM